MASDATGLPVAVFDTNGNVVASTPLLRVSDILFADVCNAASPRKQISESLSEKYTGPLWQLRTLEYGLSELHIKTGTWDALQYLIVAGCFYEDNLPSADEIDRKHKDLGLPNVDLKSYFEEYPVIRKNRIPRIAEFLTTFLSGEEQFKQPEVLESGTIESFFKQNQMLGAMFDTVENVGLVLSDLTVPEPAIIAFSKGAEIMFGYTRSEITGKPVTTLHETSDLSDYLAHLSKSSDDCTEYSGETLMLRKGGESFPALLTCSPIYDSDGTHVASLGVCLDISELRQAERHEHFLEDNLQKIIDLLPYFLMVKDYDGKIILANEATAQLFNIPVSEMTGMDFRDIGLEDDNIKRILEDDRRVMDQNTPQIIEEELHKKVSRETITSRTSRVPYNSYQGKAVLVLAMDITEEKHYLKQIQTSETRLQTVLHAGQIAIWDFNVLTGEHYYSDTYAEMLGYAPSELGNSRESFMSRLHPDDRKRIQKAVTDALAKPGEPFYEEEFRMLHKDGSYRWIHSRGMVTAYDEDGRPLRVMGAQTDITERKMTDMALEESEWKYRQLYQASFDGIVSCDMHGKFERCNPAYEKMLGYSIEELKDMWFWEVTPEEEHEWEQKLVKEKITRDGHSGLYEKHYIRKDGTIFPIELSVYLIRDVNGEPSGMWAYVRDITERKEQERALLESEWRFRQLYEASFDGIASVNKSLVMNDANPAFCRMLGYTKDELLGRTTRSLTPSKWHTWETEYVSNALAVYGSTGIYEKEYIRKDGATIPVELIVFPIHTKQNEITGYWAYARDITQRKRLEEERKKYNHDLENRVKTRTSQLEALNEELASFAHAISHDLRAPLRSINAFSQILLDEHEDQLNEDGKNYLSRINGASLHISNLIDGLLKLARLKREDLKNEDVDLSQIAKEIAAELQAISKHKRYEFDIEPDLHANGDPYLLRIILENLLNNAWKFTSNVEKPLIEFGAIEINDQKVFYVKDNGAGFDMRYIDKLFVPLQRLHSPGEFEGIGIGLATVSRIIKQHKGKIWAESNPGEGAVFYFTLNKTLPDASNLS